MNVIIGAIGQDQLGDLNYFIGGPFIGVSAVNAEQIIDQHTQKPVIVWIDFKTTAYYGNSVLQPAGMRTCSGIIYVFFTPASPVSGPISSR